ncbi:MAG TPA: M48 family peptidase, partial [Sorangium sp.]|nr:M48 family peptidase [Sorangium sp.]
MATVGELNFQNYVNSKQANRATEEGGRDDEHAYCYVSDRNTRKTFDTLRPVQMVIEAVVRLLRTVGRNELLGTAVKVGPQQFPRVHRIGVACADTLGIAPPTIYIRNNPVLNAFTYGTNDDAFIMVHSALVDHFDDDELSSVIAHECGHIHNDHVVYLTAIHYLTNMASMFVRYVALPARLALMGWSRRAEITCDRAALMCTKNLAVSERALSKLALGSTKLYGEFNLD